MSPAASVRPVPVPAASMALQAYAVTHLADAFEARLPPGTVDDPMTLARFVFETQPSWATLLMRMRDALVGVFGLKTASGLRRSSDRRVGIFKVYRVVPGEVLLGDRKSVV